MMSTANADTNELEKFERMAHRWWDPEGEFKPLHQMNPIRANYIDERSPVAEMKVLDVGCGGGLLSEALAQRGAVVSAIDLAKGPLEVAKLHAQENGLEIAYSLISAEELSATNAQTFDVITCLEMLEHVPDPHSIIASCKRMLKPGGSMYFSTINRNLKAYTMAVLGAEYLLKWLPKGTHEYKKFIRPSELCSWTRQCGLEVCDLSGITYSPIQQKFKITPYDTDVNYIGHFRLEE